MEATSGLCAEELTIRYGGHTAVDQVSLHAEPGQITGLIGPNGAGKTTIFNACSGFLRPSSGRITLFGEDVTRLRPAARARRGLGRTFQRLELCDSMTVRENLGLAVESRLAGDNPLVQLFVTRGQRRQVGDAVEQAAETCGITDLLGRPAGLLSTGQRRLVELARTCAGGYRFLLLDEPSSGLDHSETERFGQILRSLADQRIGILLVEHDMELVMSVCDHIFVLDFGTLIFSGTTSETRESPAVRAAYLGADFNVSA